MFTQCKSAYYETDQRILASFLRSHLVSATQAVTIFKSVNHLLILYGSGALYRRVLSLWDVNLGLMCV